MNEKSATGKETGKPGLYRPALKLYHPNAKGTGSAIEIKLHPAHDDVDGSIMLRIANQCFVGDRNAPTPTFSRFDWENAICVKLDFMDLCKILQVFRGECESIDDGNGLFHITAKASTKINLRHETEPASSYTLFISRAARDGDSVRAHMTFSACEALGLCEAITKSMSVIAFGIPMLVPHDTSAYTSEQRRFRDARAH